MNQRFFISLACFLLLVVLVAVPVLAATVTCPASCSCLLPAEARKLGFFGYCQGKQAVCGYDTKNEKYCYEKPSIPATVPHPVITAKPFVTIMPTTVALQNCAPGCSCLSAEDGKTKSLAYCNRQMTLCGKDSSGAGLYCFSGPVPTTAAAPPPAVTKNRTPVAVMTTPVASCPAGCSCLAPEKAGAAEMKRCSGSPAACSADPSGRLMYCYVTSQATKESRTAISTVTSPAYDRMPPAGVPATPALTAPAPGGGIISQILNFFGSLFGAPQTGALSQLVFCNGELTNLMTDLNNCGGCGNRCPEDNPNVCCRGTCFDFWNDENNCGGCGQVCPASMNCCLGTCRDLQSDIHSCGSCQRLCGESEVCSCGICVNQDEEFFLDPGCVREGVAAAIVIPIIADDDTDDSPDRGEPCTNATPCLQSGMTCCSDRCRNLNTSVGNCGSCGYSCPAGLYCREGTCTNESVVP